MNFNQTAGDPSLSDVLDAFKRQIFLDLNCHAVATVQGVDYDNQVLTAQINYTKTQVIRNPNGTTFQKQIDYPLLSDIPFISLSGGLLALTFPIQVGDQCLILFNDRDLNNWISGARSGPVATPNLHSFSDAIAIVGLNKISSFDSDRAVFGNKDAAFIGVGDTLIKVANAATSLGEILTQLNTALTALMVSMETSPITPWEIAVASAATACATSLASIQTLTSELLE